MQENTPAQSVEIKGVKIEIPPKMIRLNHDMWGTYKYLEGVASPGDFLLTLGALRLDNGDIAIIVKVINVNGKTTDNGKE